MEQRKYTIEEFKQGRKAVWIKNQGQWDKVNKKCMLAGFICAGWYSNSGSRDTIEVNRLESWYHDNGVEGLYFSQLVFEDEFVLPEKFAVFGEPNSEVAKWFQKEGGNMANIPVWYCHPAPFTRNTSFPNTCGENVIPSGYSKISNSQFKEHVLKQNPKMEKEIIGYKSPETLFCGDIAKGTIYVMKEKYHNGYYPKDRIGTENNAYYLPKEIVEKWEPVYREDKKLPVINRYNGSYGKNDLTVLYGYAIISISMLKEVFQANNLVGDRKIKSITLDSGVSITMDQIGEILEYVKFVNEQ
jgi:hypothetical protein